MTTTLKRSLLACFTAGAVLAVLPTLSPVHGQGVEKKGKKAGKNAKTKEEPKDDSAVRGSLVEDRLARKLVEAGDARYDGDEKGKAVEIWQSVIERYPRSRVRFEAHMRLGNHLLDRDRAYDRARIHFEAVAAEENPDEATRAGATLKMGVCFYEARNFGKCFQIMRDVIERFPVSAEVNSAYYYIGLGHFQLGHYSRAISALEKVGTALSGQDAGAEKLEAGKRFFIRIEDADLAALESGKTVKATVRTTQGDVETVDCHPVGRNVRLVLGSIPTVLGKPKPGNGRLEVRGDDKIEVNYIDQHTADRQFDRPVTRKVEVVGNAIVAVVDGAFAETLGGVVLGKGVNLQVTDGDRDLSDAADKLKVVVEVLREKTTEELALDPAAGVEDKDGKKEIEKFKAIDRVEVTLTEAKIIKAIIAPSRVEEPKDDAKDEKKDDAKDEKKKEEEKAPAVKKVEPSIKEVEVDDGTIHSGVFRAGIELERAEEVKAGDLILQALPGDFIRVSYVDESWTGEGTRNVTTRARCVEGNLGGVRVTRAQISDQELRVKTLLKTADALTNIGNRYKEFGLKTNADAKYNQALKICEEISVDARKLGGRVLEETYVQLWQIYFAMDKLELAAAMSQRLQNEFPNSEFVDVALLQLADVARKRGDFQRAAGIYGRLVGMKDSQLRGEAQFGIAECYEEMAKKAPNNGGAQMFDRAFQEYKKVYDQFPESGRVGEAVAKMANYYYQQKDYARAVDVFENVLSNHPDAKFLDVILFNYGRCLYRMERKGDARKQFDHLIGDFPESPLAADAKKISEALRKAGF